LPGPGRFCPTLIKDCFISLIGALRNTTQKDSLSPASGLSLEISSIFRYHFRHRAHVSAEYNATPVQRYRRHASFNERAANQDPALGAADA
jgi:hypothetical protein